MDADKQETRLFCHLVFLILIAKSIAGLNDGLFGIRITIPCLGVGFFTALLKNGSR